MGKRENEGRRSKKHKRHRIERHKSPVPKIPDNEEDVDVNVEQNEEHDVAEEVVCDNEAEGDCVDVEETNEELNGTITSIHTTPPPKPSTSKAAAAATSNKKSTTKQISSPPPNSQQTPIAPNVNAANAKSKTKKRRESGTSSDEERWLTAIESGKLEEVDDELKKIKDPKLMTARQRAMYERNLDKEPSPGGELLMSLPTGYREKEKPQTAEDIQKAALKSQKRKQLADEKREKDKKKTMERLLKKQESKQRSAAARNKGVKVKVPMISYCNSTKDGVYIQLPPEHDFPLLAQVAREPPRVQLCGIAGCGQPKVYNCSKTNLPLCSFACYRKNVQAVRQIMC